MESAGLLTWLLQSIGGKPFDYFEFGVMSCRTFNRVIEGAANREARFYGFDTFEGLPEPWVKETASGALRLGRAAGELKSEHAPAVYDARATLFKGLFQDTLPEALERAFPNGGRRSVLSSSISTATFIRRRSTRSPACTRSCARVTISISTSSSMR